MKKINKYIKKARPQNIEKESNILIIIFWPISYELIINKFEINNSSQTVLQTAQLSILTPKFWGTFSNITSAKTASEALRASVGSVGVLSRGQLVVPRVNNELFPAPVRPTTPI